MSLTNQEIRKLQGIVETNKNRGGDGGRGKIWDVDPLPAEEAWRVADGVRVPMCGSRSDRHMHVFDESGVKCNTTFQGQVKEVRERCEVPLGTSWCGECARWLRVERDGWPE